MPIAIQIALTAGPLAAYLVVLGAWQGGRDPKLVPGAIDFGLLVFGLGGLVAFGPVGKVLIGLLFPGPSLWAWLALPTSIALIALLWAPRVNRRLIVYNIDPETLERSLAEVLATLSEPGAFSRTLRGFEDVRSGRGLLFDTSIRGRTAVVEAIGERPEALISAVAPLLRERVRGSGLRGSAISRIWYTLAALVILSSIVLSLLGHGPIRSAWRSLLGNLLGK